MSFSIRHPSVVALEKTRGALGPRVFTFIHGDDKAKMDFFSADRYCKTHVITDHEAKNNMKKYMTPDEYKPLPNYGRHFNHSEKSRLVLETRLASVHSHPENSALVNWVSKQEKHSFWIGGIITKTLNEYLRPIFVLKWTDGSRGDFSFLRLPNPELMSIRTGEERCVSVDYLSGQWGIHNCNEKRYFACLSTPVLKPSTPKPTIRRIMETQSMWSLPKKKKTVVHNHMSADELKKFLFK